MFSSRHAYMILSFAKTILWIVAITMPLIWWLPGVHAPGHACGVSINSVAGGFMFDLGATFLQKSCRRAPRAYPVASQAE